MQSHPSNQGAEIIYLRSQAQRRSNLFPGKQLGDKRNSLFSSSPNFLHIITFLENQASKKISVTLEKILIISPELIKEIHWDILYICAPPRPPQMKQVDIILFQFKC